MSKNIQPGVAAMIADAELKDLVLSDPNGKKALEEFIAINGVVKLNMLLEIVQEYIIFGLDLKSISMEMLKERISQRS